MPVYTNALLADASTALLADSSGNWLIPGTVGPVQYSFPLGTGYYTLTGQPVGLWRSTSATRAVKRGSTAPVTFKRGSAAVTKLYRGRLLVWEAATVVPYVPPVLGTGIDFDEGTNFSTFTWSNLFTPVGARVILRLVARASGAGQPNLTATFQGKPVTLIVEHHLTSANRGLVFIGHVAGLTSGSPGNLTVNLEGNWGNVTGRICNISNWSGNVGGKAAAAVTKTTATNTHSVVEIPVQQGGSLAVAVAGACTGTMDPYTASGWTKETDEHSGSGVEDTDTSAGFFNRVLGSGQYGFTWTGATNHTQLMAAAAELY
jgi:hypothetical protein